MSFSFTHLLMTLLPFVSTLPAIPGVDFVGRGWDAVTDEPRAAQIVELVQRCVR